MTTYFFKIERLLYILGSFNELTNVFSVGDAAIVGQENAKVCYFEERFYLTVCQVHPISNVVFYIAR